MIAGIDAKLHTQGVIYFVTETLKLVKERTEHLRPVEESDTPDRLRAAMASASLALVSENVHTLSVDELTGLRSLILLAHGYARRAWEKPHYWAFLRLPGNAVRELKEFRQAIGRPGETPAPRQAMAA